jgi:uncharacterized protein (TIGR00255 family)
MTGFGRGVAEHGSARATVDIRAVNHRFLDVKLRGSLSPSVEEAVASRVRAALDRGAVTVTAHIARDTAPALRIDAVAARAAHGVLDALARTLGTPGPELALVLAQPGVVVASDEDRQGDEPSILAAVDLALAQLAGMRDAEGHVLARELGARVDELARLEVRLGQLAAAMPAQIHRRLHDRLSKLFGDGSAEGASLDPQRLAQEIAVIADRADVTEELVRLASHLEQVRTLIVGNEPAGRRLDFLAQEIGRELNTIGSKSASVEITSLVVEAKAVLEKLREQAQNVE